MGVLGRYPSSNPQSYLDSKLDRFLHRVTVSFATFELRLSSITVIGSWVGIMGFSTWLGMATLIGYRTRLGSGDELDIVSVDTFINH